MNARDAAGVTPLHNAVLNSDTELVGLLLDAGADPGARTADGVSCVRLATGQESSALLCNCGLDQALRLAQGDENRARTALVLQAHIDRRKTPVTVVSGFLGAGKSTLIAGILAGVPETSRIAIVENEAADVSVDGEMLAGLGAVVTNVTSGCVCCKARGKLSEALAALAASGRGRFDAVIVEMSGVADPHGAVAELTADESVSEKFRIDGVVAVVDAADPDLRHVALADVVIINKVDLLPGPDRLAELQARVEAKRNPTSKVYTNSLGAVLPAEALLHLSSFVLLDNPNLDLAPDAVHEDYQTAVLTLDNPDRAHLAALLTTAAQSQGLIRAKGIVTLSDGQTVTVQLVRDALQITSTTARPPSTNKLVLIAKRGAKVFDTMLKS